MLRDFSSAFGDREQRLLRFAGENGPDNQQQKPDPKEAKTDKTEPAKGPDKPADKPLTPEERLAKLEAENKELKDMNKELMKQQTELMKQQRELIDKLDRGPVRHGMYPNQVAKDMWSLPAVEGHRVWGVRKRPRSSFPDRDPLVRLGNFARESTRSARSRYDFSDDGGPTRAPRRKHKGYWTPGTDLPGKSKNAPRPEREYKDGDTRTTYGKPDGEGENVMYREKYVVDSSGNGRWEIDPTFNQETAQEIKTRVQREVDEKEAKRRAENPTYAEKYADEMGAIYAEYPHLARIPGGAQAARGILKERRAYDDKMKWIKDLNPALYDAMVAEKEARHKLWKKHDVQSGAALMIDIDKRARETMKTLGEQLFAEVKDTLQQNGIDVQGSSSQGKLYAANRKVEIQVHPIYKSVKKGTVIDTKGLINLPPKLYGDNDDAIRIEGVGVRVVDLTLDSKNPEGAQEVYSAAGVLGAVNKIVDSKRMSPGDAQDLVDKANKTGAKALEINGKSLTPDVADKLDNLDGKSTIVLKNLESATPEAFEKLRRSFTGLIVIENAPKLNLHRNIPLLRAVLGGAGKVEIRGYEKMPASEFSQDVIKILSEYLGGGKLDKRSWPFSQALYSLAMNERLADGKESVPKGMKGKTVESPEPPPETPIADTMLEQFKEFCGKIRGGPSDTVNESNVATYVKSWITRSPEASAYSQEQFEQFAEKITELFFAAKDRPKAKADLIDLYKEGTA